MISNRLTDALSLIAASNVNAIALADYSLRLVWKNEAFGKIFGDRSEFDLSDFYPDNSLSLKENFEKKNKFSALGGVATTALSYITNFSPINDAQNEYYILEFIVPIDTSNIIKNSGINNALTAFSFQFRAPISRISNVVEALKRDLSSQQDSQNLEKQLETVDDCCMQLLRSFVNYIDLTKYSIGLYKADLTLVSLRDFLRDFSQTCQALLISKEVPIIFESPPYPCYINLDEDKFTTALANIVLNSFTYTRDKNYINITLNQDESTQTAHITIQDFGAGMTDDVLQKAMYPYFSGHKNQNMPLTQGIGLTLAKHIISLHGGRIEISSKINVGTTVKISIPLGNNKTEDCVLRCPSVSKFHSRYSTIAIQFAIEEL